MPEVAKEHYKATEKVQKLKTFEKWVFFLKKMDGFFRKNPIFQKSDGGSKFAVECDWISDNSQHVTKKEISKTRLDIRKNSWFF